MDLIDKPILYSFRRCPYAMRARMAILKSGFTCRLREVNLRDKPKEMIAVSPKGTVPVMVFGDGLILEESLEIMRWTLSKNDPDKWLEPESSSLTDMLNLIKNIDEKFKFHLDRYKYSTRYQGVDPIFHREKALDALAPIIEKLTKQKYLCGTKVSMADIAIFPFIRQFANANQKWFDNEEIGPLQSWLKQHLDSKVFINSMNKWPIWKSNNEEELFP